MLGGPNISLEPARSSRTSTAIRSSTCTRWAKATSRPRHRAHVHGRRQVDQAAGRDRAPVVGLPQPGRLRGHRRNQAAAQGSGRDSLAVAHRDPGRILRRQARADDRDHRGCPFTCTFCVQGTKFYSKIHNFSVERIKEEITYIAKRIRSHSPNMGTLRIADSNYGMYERDIEISGHIGQMQRDYAWPTFIDATTGKNKPERIIKSVEKVGGALVLYQAVAVARRGSAAQDQAREHQARSLQGAGGAHARPRPALGVGPDPGVARRVAHEPPARTASVAGQQHPSDAQLPGDDAEGRRARIHRVAGAVQVRHAVPRAAQELRCLQRRKKSSTSRRSSSPPTPCPSPTTSPAASGTW